METQEIKKKMTNTEKYERICMLIKKPTQHEIAMVFCICSIPGGPVTLVKDGIRLEDHGRYYEMAAGSDMDITPEHIENINMTVAEFCKMLTEFVEAGGMQGFWPGKIRIFFNIKGWADLPLK